MQLLTSDENSKTLGYLSTGTPSFADVTGVPREMAGVDLYESNTSKVEKIYLDALPGSNYEVLRPIEITVTYIIDDGIEFIVRAADTEVVTSGETLSGAVEWLAHSIVDTYEFYLAHEHQLGPLPKRQLTALRGYIAKKQARAG